ncbi:MAG: extensin family protein, partial [Rhizobiaceae bacterium]
IAITLADFAGKASVIAEAALGSPIAELVTGPGYQCRRRNRASSGKLSEHSFANAIDISGFRLEDGRTITVEEHWPHLSGDGQTTSENEEPAEQTEPADPLERSKTEEQAFLAQSHAIACKMFTTVLGPDADAAHRNHFHFDQGCHGRNCTYLLCQ